MYEKLLNHGGELNKIEVKELRPGHKGILAKESIYEGEPLAYIPRAMLLTASESSQGSVYKKLKETGFIFNFDQGDHYRTMLYIMQERRNPFSEFYDWIATLPKN